MATSPNKSASHESEFETMITELVTDAVNKMTKEELHKFFENSEKIMAKARIAAAAPGEKV